MSGRVYFKLQITSIPEPIRGFIGIYEKLRGRYNLGRQWPPDSPMLSRLVRTVYEEPPPYRPDLKGEWQSRWLSDEEWQRCSCVEQAVRAYKWVQFGGVINIGLVVASCGVECFPQENNKGAVKIDLCSMVKSNEILDIVPFSKKEWREYREKRSALLQFCVDMAQAADARGFALFRLDNEPTPIIRYVDLLREFLSDSALYRYCEELAMRAEKEPELRDELEELLEVLTAPEDGDELPYCWVLGIKEPPLPPASWYRPVVYDGYQVVSHL